VIDILTECDNVRGPILATKQQKEKTMKSNLRAFGLGTIIVIVTGIVGFLIWDNAASKQVTVTSVSAAFSSEPVSIDDPVNAQAREKLVDLLVDNACKKIQDKLVADVEKTIIESDPFVRNLSAFFNKIPKRSDLIPASKPATQPWE
jgi:hypothetical protein